MPDIVLATLNARYIHSAFGLRYLYANLGGLRERAVIREFSIATRPADIAEALLAERPRILGLGVYIWNATQTAALVGVLRAVAPRLRIVLGGPEVSHETEAQPLCAAADVVIRGEADHAFAAVCRQLLAGEQPGPVVDAPLPDVSALALPYALYDAEDIARRVVYVEASRGCPFRCEFCLSALDIPLRRFPEEALLAAFEELLRRGLLRFKFVDRTFNLSLPFARKILRFFRERYRPGLFLHFEMIPDRLPAALRTELAAFPPGAVQLEIGIQTFDPAVGRRISRTQDVPRLEDNLRFLRAETGVHLHTDLIVGLPGESLESFGRGFDRLVALRPHEIQVGILKRLRGTPIVRHTEAFAMRYDPEPPYALLSNRDLDFPTVQRLKRFARYWDLIANSGNFPTVLPALWTGERPFPAFLALSDWLHEASGRTHGIALKRLAGMLFRWLTDERGGDPAALAPRFLADYRGGGRRDVPAFLRPWVGTAHGPTLPTDARLPRRQARHLAAREGTREATPRRSS